MIFPCQKQVLKYHALQLAKFGGSAGLRDEGALESALMAAQNRPADEEASLAITYAYHLCKAHAFLDGNKRIAAIIAELFVELNGAKLNATNHEMELLILAIADNRLTRDEVEQLFAQWVAPLS